MVSAVTSTQAVKQLQSVAPEWERHGVARAWLFGSRARGEAEPGSDWDILVEFSRPPTFDDYMGLKLRLETALGNPVDLVSRAACKPRFVAAIREELLDVA
jgi:predicted nucleotidyltransferase